MAPRTGAAGETVLPPDQTDKALRASLARLAGFSITAVSAWQPPDHRFILPGFKVARRPDADIGRAVALVERALAPAPRERVVAELLALKVKTRGRNQTDDDLDIELRIYAAELAAYPADVMVEGLRRAARESRWFPTWAELADILDHLAGDRRALRLYFGWLQDAERRGEPLPAPQAG